MLQRFIIERDIPKVGTYDSRQLKEAAIKSNEVLKQLGFTPENVAAKAAALLERVA